MGWKQRIFVRAGRHLPGANLYVEGRSASFAVQQGADLPVAHPMHASVTKLVHIPSLNQVWSAADDGSICVWNGKAYQLQRNIPEAHSGKIIELIAIGNEFVLSGSVDQRIRLWDSISTLHPFQRREKRRGRPRCEACQSRDAKEGGNVFARVVRVTTSLSWKQGRE